MTVEARELLIDAVCGTCPGYKFTEYKIIDMAGNFSESTGWLWDRTVLSDLSMVQLNIIYHVCKE